MAAKKKAAKKKKARNVKARPCNTPAICAWLDKVAPIAPIVTGPVTDTGEPILTQWDAAWRLMWDAIRQLERIQFCGEPMGNYNPLIAVCPAPGSGPDKTPPPPPPDYP